MKGFLQRFLQDIMKKKIIFGTSDAWSMGRSSHQANDTEYYIKDCRISRLLFSFGTFESSLAGKDRN